jgi:hypothetical protein
MYNFNWNYNPEDYTPNTSGILAEGDYRVCISSAMPTTAKTGTHGLEITLDVNGHSNNLKHYIWFNPNDVQRTNQKLGQFFNSFDIGPNEQNSCAPWCDKKGAVHVVHSEYKGRTIAKVAYCIERDKQDKLPEWQEDEPIEETKPSVVEPTVAPRRSLENLILY